MEELPERNASQPEPEDRPAEAGQETAEAAENAPVEAGEEAAEVAGSTSSEAPEAASVEPESEPAAPQPEAADVETAEAPEEIMAAAEAPEESVEPATTPVEAVEPVERPAEAAVPVEAAAAVESVETAETSALGDIAEAAETPETVAAAESIESAQIVEDLAVESAPEAVEVRVEEKAAAPVPPAKPAGPRLADLKAGMVMDGTVTRIERYGAFVSLGLADRRDGLIHISQLASYRVNRVEDVVKVGDQVRARVVSVDLAKGRIGLSLNDVPMESYAEADTASSEPALTAMQLAFERAYGRRREESKETEPAGPREDLGTRRRREHEELMRKLRSGS